MFSGRFAFHSILPPTASRAVQIRQPSSSLASPPICSTRRKKVEQQVDNAMSCAQQKETSFEAGMRVLGYVSACNDAMPDPNQSEVHAPKAVLQLPGKISGWPTPWISQQDLHAF